MVDVADRIRRHFPIGDPQQRACGNHVGTPVNGEEFERGDRIRTALYLVEEQQKIGAFRSLVNLYRLVQGKTGKDVVGAFTALKDAFIIRIFFKIQTDDLFVIRFAEMFDGIRFSDLSRAFNNQRLVTRIILPFL